MRFLVFITLLVLALSRSPNNAHAMTSIQEHPYVKNEAIIKLTNVTKEQQVLKNVEGVVKNRLTPSMILIQLEHQSVLQAVKLLTENPDVEFAVPNYITTQSVSEDSASQIELWNLASAQDTSVAVILRQINEKDSETQLAFFDIAGTSNEYISLGEKVRNLDFVDDDYDYANTIEDDTLFFHAKVLNDVYQGTDADIIQALLWSKQNGIELVGLNALSEVYSPAIDEIISDFHDESHIVRFTHKKLETDNAEPTYGQMTDIIIPLKKQPNQIPVVTPILYPVPTRPIADDSNQNNNLMTVSEIKIKETRRDEDKDLTVTVTVTSTQDSKTIAGALVTIDLITPSKTTYTGAETTNENGQSEFILSNLLELGTYSVRLISLTKDNYQTVNGISDAYINLQ